MSKIIHLYILDKNSIAFKRFDNIVVSQNSINRALNDPDAEVMSINAYYSPYNMILKDILGVNTMWVPINEGEVISSNRSILWLTNPDDLLAIQKFMEYEVSCLKDFLNAYEKTLHNFSKQIKYLQSKIDNPHPECYSLETSDSISEKEQGI